MIEIPYNVEPRKETGLYNAKLGVWIFLASEIMLFGGLFSAYILLRVGSPVWPPNGAELSIPLATLNTFNLILSSWTIVKSWIALKENNFGGFKKYMGVTLVCSLVFMVIKYIEYTSKFSHGIFPSTDNFYGIYFTLTGLHGLHVIGGLILNYYLWRNFDPIVRDRTNEYLKYLILFSLFLPWDSDKISLYGFQTINGAVCLYLILFSLFITKFKMLKKYNPIILLIILVISLVGLENYNNKLYYLFVFLSSISFIDSIILKSKVTFKTDPINFTNRVEVAGLYWHFVDLVWIFLFPVLYLLN